MKKLRYIVTTILVLVLALSLWAFWIEPSGLKVSEKSVELTNWPSSCNGLRIAVLADLHVGSPHNGIDNLEKIVAATNDAEPDIVLLAGDYVIQGVVGGKFVSPELAASVLAKLKPKYGVFAVLGNHDWWLNPAQVGSALSASGIRVLEDKSAKLNIENCQFHLVGISDYWEGPHDVELAFSQVPDGSTSIVFTHNPDIFPKLPFGFSLLIAGHTHGGQVYFPGIGRPIVPSDYGSRYAAGHIEEDGQHMYVSTGIGTSILPVRFLVPPEITVLSLYSKVAPDGT